MEFKRTGPLLKRTALVILSERENWKYALAVMAAVNRPQPADDVALLGNNVGLPHNAPEQEAHDKDA
jgi:hypothetical protein